MTSDTAQQPDTERAAAPIPADPPRNIQGATVVLPPFDSASETHDPPTTSEPPRQGAYHTILLPSVSVGEQGSQQETGQTLEPTASAADEPKILIPGAPTDDETPNIVIPGDAAPADNATIIVPGDAASEPRPTIRLPDADVPSPGATIVMPSGDDAAVVAPPRATTPLPEPPVMPPPARSSYETGALPSQSYDAPPVPPASYPAGTLPAGATPISQAPAANGSRRQLYWILGGVGCLLLILLLACAVFALFVLGSTSGGTSGLLAAATVTSAPQVTRTLRATSAARIQPSAVGTPSAGSGSVLVSDDFSDPNRSGLSVGEDSETNYAFEDGVYAITVKVPRLLVWSIFDGTYGDVRAEVDTTLDEGPDDAATALIFRYQDNGNFYVYNIAGDGRYNLEMMKGNSLTTLIDWTPSPAIKSKGEANRIRLETQGNRISLYANDTKLEELSDNTFLKGQIALAVNTFDQGGARVVFDNLLVKTE